MAIKNYKILVLPSGAATGIVSSTILAQLERDTGIPIYQHFDEIWSSSIGSMIAALLTTPKKKSGGRSLLPMTATEVTEFLESSFSSWSQAIRVRGKFKKQLPALARMRDTFIPLRVLSAEVVGFSWIWPLKTRFRSFTSAKDGDLSLASVVASSCTVFPLHPFAEPVGDSEGQVIYCIDAGCEVCTESCMNPLLQHFPDLVKDIDPKVDSVDIYFISNGWVRLDSSWSPSKKGKILSAGGKSVILRLFNIDVNLSSTFQKWQKGRRVGGVFDKFKSEHIFYNLVGGGIISSAPFKIEAAKISENSESYKSMLESLRRKSENE
ncbi:MAG: hypothetical protein ABIQ95_09695 [Bdellovibrionia bacterium]